MNIWNKVMIGDNLIYLEQMDAESINMIYLDPPFFTNKKHKNSKNDKFYEFDDVWESMENYLDFLRLRFLEMRRILKNDGSIFIHIDKTASHYVKVLLDSIFGEDNFRSEIIWSYKRWSNSKKGLLNNHQVILFYSKTDDFKFNTIYTDYSVTTNLDQILQDRIRDERGKSVYKKDEMGNTVIGGPKKGVPLSDVWEIPFLNPKAKERVGYPTQKPILLLERIVQLVTDEGDLVLDPFCGSGTTLVAAKILGRKYCGMDLSEEAVLLSKERLSNPVKSKSMLLMKGKEAYQNKNDDDIRILESLDAKPVQRNKGIDGYLNYFVGGKPVPIKIQEKNQTVSEAIRVLLASKKAKEANVKILVVTSDVDELSLLNDNEIPNDIKIIHSIKYQMKKLGL